MHEIARAVPDHITLDETISSGADVRHFFRSSSMSGDASRDPQPRVAP
jgi:hypothetical protein